MSSDNPANPRGLDALENARVLFQSGIQAQANGDLSGAELCFREALESAPGRPSILINLGAVLVLSGQFDKACGVLGQVLLQDPANALAHLNLANCHSAQGDWQKALVSLCRAREIDEDNPQIRNLFGRAVEERYQEGAALYISVGPTRARSVLEEVVAAEPTHYGASVLLGTLEQSEGRPEPAFEWFSRAAAIKSDDPALYGVLGSLLIDLNKLPEALKYLDHSLSLDATLAEIHYNRGWVLQHLGRLQEAVLAYDRALAINPAQKECLNDKATALHALGQYEEALFCVEMALRMAPDFAEAYSNRGYFLNSLKDHRRLPEALASLDQAVSLNPQLADAWDNRGTSLLDMARVDEAIASYDRAIQLNPKHAKAHWNKGLALLLQGRFAEGWPLYEWRWHPDLQGRERSHSQPLWLGQESLAGKTILLQVEQGYGDTLQMCRFTKDLAERGASVILEVLPPLQNLLSGLVGVKEVFLHGDTLPAFDFYCPFMSLPLALQVDETSLSGGAPYLACSEAKRSLWSARLGRPSRPRIGIAWSGNPTHKNDINRSIQIHDLMMHLPRSVEWISLQKEVHRSDQEVIRSGLIRHFGDALHDFTDTAALCSLVDHVVTVDTSVAHLSGGLGCNTTVLLPFVPDWRWLMDREDSPWYASVRLMRQGSDREWAPLLRSIFKQYDAG